MKITQSELKKLEDELNIEYKDFGTVTISEAYTKKINIPKIEYVKTIMDSIKPLDIEKPIIVAKKYYDDKYCIIDGYHRLKNKIIKEEKSINAIVLEDYDIKEKFDNLFSFLETLKGKTIKFLDDYLLQVKDDLYEIETNEGCGGCANGWSSMSVLEEFINKEIKVKSVKQVEDSENSDIYKLLINEEVIADVDTGWGNGYYGGDFTINLIK